MSDDSTGGFAQLVPELYYDLIARLPAGLLFWMLIGCWWLHRSGTALITPTNLNAIPAGSMLLVALALGYVIIIVTGPVSNLVRRLYLRIAWWRVYSRFHYELHLLFAQLRPVALDQDGCLKRFHDVKSADFEIFHLLLHERLKHMDPQARALLPKFRAEASLCDNVVVVFILFTLVVLSVDRTLPQLHVAVMFGALAGLALISGLQRYLGALVKHVAFAVANGLCAGPAASETTT